MSVSTVEKMIKWVEDNIDDNPTLEKMAHHVGYSEFYCSSKFHEITGVTFKEYVLKRKLSLAAVSLLETNDRILDVAVNFGFSSNEAFSRAFCREYGCSPKKFRISRPQFNYFERLVVIKGVSL
ncbi:MAG: helix-turn-helix transcriptional regulator [Clostridia bacterium]|nr:helix-turn-helix transcriptional regulator [Clostridia bacterium]